jgi:hypothetical protein
MIEGPSHHVALLREPELVVEYREGPAPVAAGTEWAAVFRTRRAEDGAFAAAEPPTHDTWNPDLLPRGPEKTKVNVALREIDKVLRDRWSPVALTTTSGPASTAPIANDLAVLVRGFDGSGPGLRDDSGKGGGGGGNDGNGGRKRVERPRAVVDRISAAVVDGIPGTCAQVRIECPDDRKTLTVRATIEVALDDGASDSGLDPLLSLVRAEFSDGSAQELKGEQADVSITLPGHLSFDVLIARSRDTAVVMEVEIL